MSAMRTFPVIVILPFCQQILQVISTEIYGSVKSALSVSTMKAAQSAGAGKYAVSLHEGKISIVAALARVPVIAET